MSRIGVLGSGEVGQTLARGLKQRGHDVWIASRTGDKLADFSRDSGVAEGTFEAVARHGELLVLAVKGAVAEELVEGLAAELAGKVVIDTTNPIAGMPIAGFLPYFTGPDASLMERLAKRAPQARFVKAFNSVGSALMVQPQLPGGRPSMFVAGDDAQAKVQVGELLAELGWEAEDVGGAPSARAVEALCQLWCAPGFLRGDWTHAFKVLRP
jgi:predicted dinucleotide-binding enzyme